MWTMYRYSLPVFEVRTHASMDRSPVPKFSAESFWTTYHSELPLKHRELATYSPTSAVGKLTGRAVFPLISSGSSPVAPKVPSSRHQATVPGNTSVHVDGGSTVNVATELVTVPAELETATD